MNSHSSLEKPRLVMPRRQCANPVADILRRPLEFSFKQLFDSSGVTADFKITKKIIFTVKRNGSLRWKTCRRKDKKGDWKEKMKAPSPRPSPRALFFFFFSPLICPPPPFTQGFLFFLFLSVLPRLYQGFCFFLLLSTLPLPAQPTSIKTIKLQSEEIVGKLNRLAALRPLDLLFTKKTLKNRFYQSKVEYMLWSFRYDSHGNV